MSEIDINFNGNAVVGPVQRKPPVEGGDGTWTPFWPVVFEDSQWLATSPVATRPTREAAEAVANALNAALAATPTAASGGKTKQ